MNLDDLMEVWRSQDVAPLHGINETLLRLALREDEAKLQKQRRRERWITYVASAAFFLAMAFFIVVMMYPRGDRVRTGWDYAIPIAGAAFAVAWGSALYVSQRAQALREQRFSESLRDQLARRLAQLDYEATRAVRLASVLVTQLPPLACATAFLLASWRINGKSFREDGGLLVILIAVCAYQFTAGVLMSRRSVQHDLEPRQRRLAAMLKELDTA
jgi:ABC-type Fe3+ transport system permease subunit